MCLNPSTILNQTKKISKYGGQQFYLEVPCGKCAECVAAMRNEWMFRLYYECLDIIERKKGYVYFDTLTYASSSLPHISDFTMYIKKGSENDFSCFNTDHYRHFFLMLRQTLDRRGYDRSKVRYFLATEYGVDPRYTHRPHYHILFFVEDPTLDVVQLSAMVAQCWKHGRTDGVPYQTTAYVKKHAFGYKYDYDELVMRKVMSYVSKYVTKDSEFQKVIDERLGKIYETLDNNYIDKHAARERYKKLSRQINQFHRQSQGLGLGYLNYISEEDFKHMIKTGKMSMPDSEKVKKSIPLCNYYIRKLFYTQYRDKDNHLKWKLTEVGKKWKLDKMFTMVDSIETKMQDWFVSLPSYVKNWKNVQDSIKIYLNGRSFRDFALYKVFYKGRVRLGLQANDGTRYGKQTMKGMSPYELDLTHWIPRIFQDVDELEEDDYLWNYASLSDRREFQGDTFITDKYLGSKDEGYKTYGFRYGWIEFTDIYQGRFTDNARKSLTHSFGQVMKSESFAAKYVINEHSDPRFKNFDKITRLYNQSLEEFNSGKQALFDMKERMNKVWKKQIPQLNGVQQDYEHYSKYCDTHCKLKKLINGKKLSTR